VLPEDGDTPNAHAPMSLFRFRNPPRGNAEPLATQQSAAAWFRELPAADAIGRLQAVAQAIESACQPDRTLDFDQVGAIEFLDRELAVDRGRLITQYVEHADGAAAAAGRVWQAAYDASRGFILGYRDLVDRAVAANDGRWMEALPRLLARLIHFYGTDAKLRLLKSEPWIPAKWAELHRLFRHAIELGIARTPLGRDPAWPGGTRPTIEYEYVVVLLTNLLNTGTLAPREIDWAAAQIRLWATGLELDDAPRAPGGFVVDLEGKRGLVRRATGETGTMPRYLDTGPLAEQLERGLDALRRQVAADPGGAGLASRQHIATLQRVQPAVSPETPAAVPRETRTEVGLSAQVRVGLAPICRELASGDTQNSLLEVTGGPGAGAIVGDEAWNRAHGITAVSGVPRGETLWRVEDRSATGLRIAALAGLGQDLALGRLVAIREPRDGEWVLGVVRRIARPSADRIEAGVSIIAPRVIAVALHAKRQARDDMGFIVDGVDVSTIGERFDGLYLPPPSRPDRPLAAKTLAVPSSEYAEGRSVVLVTTRTVYTIALREPLERHPDWTWAAIDIVDRAARDRADA
jgi:hypothetical protein